MSSAMRFFLMVLGCLLAVGAATPALAQDSGDEEAPAEPTEADAQTQALRADAINKEFCATLYSSRIDQAAGATVVVAEAWQAVSEVYVATEAPYLLYWRGVLAQCLGRDEPARDDLETFVERHGEEDAYRGLTRQARLRLRRMSGAEGPGGAASAYLRQLDRLELGLDYGAGAALLIASCLDNGSRDVDAETGETGQAVNFVCRDGAGPRPFYDGLGVPLDLQVSIFGYPLEFLGLGARLWLRGAVASDDRALHLPGPGTPSFVLSAGPRFRFASGAGSARMHVEPGFALAWGAISPWAGQAQYYSELGFLDAGSWAQLHIGASLVLEGTFRASAGSVFTLTGQVAYVPAAVGPLRQVREGETTQRPGEDGEPITEAVPPGQEPEMLSQLHGRLRLGGMMPLGGGPHAMGPYVELGLNAMQIRFADDPDTYWCGGDCPQDPETCAGCNYEVRKVYSTEALRISAVVGLQVRLGLNPGAP